MPNDTTVTTANWVTLPAPRRAAGIGLINCEQIDVPSMPDIYYVPEVDNFYSRSHRRGMGDKFYRAHIHLMRSVSDEGS